MEFEKSRQCLNGCTVIRTAFLSERIRNEIKVTLGFMPSNAYIHNSAGDYLFISVVAKDGTVYTLMDWYDLEEAMQDFGIEMS